MNGYETTSPRFPQSEWDRLKAAIYNAFCLTGDTAGVARQLLRSLDQAIGPSLWKLLGARTREMCLRAGDVIPVAAHDLKHFFQLKDNRDYSLTSSPSSRDRPDNQYRYLGVLPQRAPGEEEYEVRYVFHQGPAMDQLDNVGDKGRLMVGALIPNVPGDREFEEDFCYQVDKDRGVFFDVQPRQPDRQLDRILELLGRASDSGVNVAILPELSVTEGISEKLGEWFKAHDMMVLIAGSFHAQEKARRFNRSHMFISGAKDVFQHDKFNPFFYHEREQGGERGRRITEDISAAPIKLTIHWSNGWTFTSLICKDFLDGSTLGILDKLRVNFVFVVAFSEDTETFQDDAALRLQSSGQTMTFMVNYSRGKQTDRYQGALAVIPLRAPYKVHGVPAAEITKPTLLTFDVRQPGARWEDVSSSGTQGGQIARQPEFETQ